MIQSTLSVNGTPTVVEIETMGNRIIHGSIDGAPVVLHRVGEHWYPEDPGDSPSMVQVCADVPEAVFLAITARLDADSSLTWDMVLTQALALWELQHGAAANSAVGGIYLRSMFPERMVA
jgi:hypothetical protein